MTDPAFEGVGQKEELVIWRVESFELKPVPSNEHGNFYSGDSYVILKTIETKSGGLEWNIHFWIGTESSQDEFATAAIKSVELDDLFGGKPVQYREVQNHESSLFLSYFKKGIRYLQGGIKSGFHHVEDETITRLLRVKGRRNVRLHEVPFNVSSMNKGDCFILDIGSIIYVYYGQQSGRMERIKAIQAANAIRDDMHCGRSVVKIVDSSSSNSDVEEFFEALGGGSESDVDSGVAEDDATFESNFDSKIALYRVRESEDGDLQIELTAEQPLMQEYLQNDDCYILDGGINGIFVWIGKDSSRKERVEAMNYANKYIQKKGYPEWLPVQRIIHEAETPLFKSYFSIWEDPDDQTFELIKETVSKATGEDIKYELFVKNMGKAASFMPDDGSGDVEIWKVENFDIVPIDPSQRGIFFGGDSYIVKYTYRDEDHREHCILYFWLGQSSSQDEKATAAIMTVKLDNEMNGKATQVRVVHGQEPEHFLRIFQGQMVILMGGHASGFKNIHDYDSYDVDGTRLFQVKGTNNFNTRAEQVQEVSSSLNSSDVFILETPSATYLWIGKKSCEDELEMGRKIIQIVSPDCQSQEINEGDEPEEFWASLGGKEEYPESRDFPSRPALKPRLFKLSNQSGHLTVEEMCHFVQEDLCEDDVMVLDAGNALYIWVGKGADEEEKSAALELSEKYLSVEPTHRSADNTVIITVKQGAEPKEFKYFFGNWNPSMWENMCQHFLKLYKK